MQITVVFVMLIMSVLIVFMYNSRERKVCYSHQVFKQANKNCLQCSQHLQSLIKFIHIL